MTENEWMEQVRDLAKLYGWLGYHTHRSDRSDAGFPDLVLVKGERVVYVELKAEKGRLSPDQKKWLRALVAAGQETAVWRPSDLQTASAVLGPRGVRATVAAELIA